ncbi:hypothetical protein G6F57_007672 [Rhizopus arrhizus]|nr:hypothetical protein G6F28_008486 [Rhizopus arrhizus]KAG1035796.1 hypothetical protein G6F25_008538 [Rhizopus arrhizus]KAG1093824.1 hypothetical protein G6F39_008459 [Rhizopus arrhizus]KAG1477757.1 hypothetical protein G6F57_007672 [Rhizopus arrhizus]
MDQKVVQLREFDGEVLSQPESAASFATKGFLESLIEIVMARLDKEDDGSDQFKEELRILKSATRAFTIIVPFLFKTVCQNEAESKLWEMTHSFIQTVRYNLLNHVNSGVKIHAIKCLQVVIFLLSKSSQKDLSLYLLRSNHRILNVQTLEKEGQEVLETILNLFDSDIESVLTASISCLLVTVKRRPQFLKPVVARWIGWKNKRTQNDSPVMIRNVEKAIRLAFVSLIRTESLAAYRQELLQGFGSVGGNPAMFQQKETRRQKRQAVQQEETATQKKARLSEHYTPVIPSASSPHLLANYDITQIPPAAIVQLCMTVLQTVPLEVMTERVAMLPKEGVTLAVTRPGFVRSTTPPYPPPPEQPERIDHPSIKREKVKREDLDSDEEMEEVLQPVPVIMREPIVKEEEVKPKVEVLASVEERANQLFKAQPYALVTAKPTTMNDEQRQTMIKMTFERILQSQSALMDHQQVKIWSTLVAKLVTRGINSNNNNKIMTDEIKALSELALAWLNEEHPGEDYFIWFHQLLEKSINTLDAKDRTLTKLLMDAPALDAQCVALVKQNLEHMPERFVTCISTLRSLVTNKVGVRYEALQVLLDLCVHPYDKMRRTSIVAVKKWNVDQEDIDARVEAYSIRVLHQLTEEAKEEEGEGWTEKEVVRHAELYFVLCTKKPSLLKELFSVYTQSSETVQEAIRAHIVNMIKSIGMKSSDLISLLRECPEGTESLVIRIIAILCESKPPTREIMATVESLSTERSVDVQSLEPILAGHSLNHKKQ